MSSAVLFDELPGKGGNLGLITLNRPQALNALSHEMIISMQQKLVIWENNPNIKAVVVRAAEGRAFCAGGDLRLAYDKHAAQDPSLFHFFRDEYRLNHFIFHYSKPYIAFLDGITMGGGAGISINGSHCVGTERLIFAMPETGIGFFPDVGASYFLSRLPHGVGFYLGLTGSRLNVDDCLEIGLIHSKAHSADLPELLNTLAETPFSGKARDAVTKILHQFQQTPAVSSLAEHYSFISQHFVKHRIEDILSVLESQQTPWHQDLVKTLKKKSPSSLKIALRQLHEGVKRDFDQCMQLEYQLMWHFIQSHDFFEGIRAVLIEKTQDPQWRPAEFSAISQEDVESFLLPQSGRAAQLLFT